jgi:hypothetical protein
VPDHVLYRILFHDVFLRKQQALKAENEGKAGLASAWRNTYKRDALMSDDQATILEQIAEQCELEVAQQDARARIVIECDKARYPGRQVPPGETLQPPSPELFEMQKERNAIILRFRDHLHDAFGEAEFSRFQDFLRRKLAPQITSTPSAIQGAESR